MSNLEIGQIVYVKNEIMGWFDRSLERRIPVNAICKILKKYQSDRALSYQVEFLGKWSEFGQLIVNSKDLKMDNN